MKNVWLFNSALLLFCVVFVQDSRAQDDNLFNLPEGARARLGKGRLSIDDRSVAYSPDGTRLAVASSLGIWLYDAHTYTEVALLTDHTQEVFSVAFSPDEKILASTHEGTVRLWDTDSGALKATLKGYRDYVSWVAFAPDGKTIAMTSQYAILLWDIDSILASDNTVVSLGDEETLKVVLVSEGKWMGPLTFAPDGKILASGGDFGGILLWDIDSILARDYTVIRQGDLDMDMGWAIKDTLVGPRVNSVAFAPDGKTIAASAKWDQTARLWDTDSGALKARLEGHMDQVSSVAFAPDGKTIASASDDGTVRLWEADSGAPKTTLKGHTAFVRSVAFAPDGKTIASASRDQTVRLWEADSGAPMTTLKGHKHGFSSVAFAPDGKTIAAAAIGHETWLWEADTVATFGHEIWLWEADSGTRKAILEGHTDEITSMRFSPDGKTIASASRDQTVRLWEADSGTRKAILEGHNRGWFFSATFSPDGKTIATTNRTDVFLWDTDSGTRKTTLEGHMDQVYLVVFAPDGKTIATASRDGTVRLWEADSGTRKAILEGHNRGWFFPATFSPDGKTIASADSAHVFLWDTDSGTRKITLEGHTDDITSVRFSPDGKTIASASKDGSILLWDMVPYITPSIPTAVQSSSTMLPTQTVPLANFPNPFNPDTYIPYQLHAPAHVRLKIYDVRGALVREIDLGYRTAGQYLTSTRAAHWDGRDRRGQHVASGVYLYRLQAGPVAQVRKMVVIK